MYIYYYNVGYLDMGHTNWICTKLFSLYRGRIENLSREKEHAYRFLTMEDARKRCLDLQNVGINTSFWELHISSNYMIGMKYDLRDKVLETR